MRHLWQQAVEVSRRRWSFLVPLSRSGAGQQRIKRPVDIVAHVLDVHARVAPLPARSRRRSAAAEGPAGRCLSRRGSGSTPRAPGKRSVKQSAHSAAATVRLLPALRYDPYCSHLTPSNCLTQTRYAIYKDTISKKCTPPHSGPHQADTHTHIHTQTGLPDLSPSFSDVHAGDRAVRCFRPRDGNPWCRCRHSNQFKLFAISLAEVTPRPVCQSSCADLIVRDTDVGRTKCEFSRHHTRRVVADTCKAQYRYPGTAVNVFLTLMRAG
jgi:hypothetical protein